MGTIVYAYLLSGVVSLTIAAVWPPGLGRFRGLPPRYLWGCGALFVAYASCYCLALGLATDRAQVLGVGLVNYLWPSLTLASLNADNCPMQLN